MTFTEAMKMVKFDGVVWLPRWPKGTYLIRRGDAIVIVSKRGECLWQPGAPEQYDSEWEGWPGEIPALCLRDAQAGGWQ